MTLGLLMFGLQLAYSGWELPPSRRDLRAVGRISPVFADKVRGVQKHPDGSIRVLGKGQGATSQIYSCQETFLAPHSL